MLPSRSHCKLYPTDGYCDDENEQPFAPAFAFAPSFHFPSCQPNHTPLYILPSESGELVGEIRGEISESVWHLLSSRRRRSAERRKANEETTIDGGGSTRFELLDFPKRAMMTTLLPSIEEDGSGIKERGRARERCYRSTVSALGESERGVSCCAHEPSSRPAPLRPSLQPAATRSQSLDRVELIAHA